ncbi:pyridine nucleotide-disulfide oxidoreductase [Bacillus canaveralius]|uniref:Pyridine nucleotide-disulfide oxidoreductase n=1 Tax=Bacillus canaveralius TaxID=1403243 RepID=A0A2N5GL72_9BACI|nr:FAD/NAD(P)-binding oxidoreductase [Bacillus canaveralius]PLR82220.1 pyridine nucleotide-disulfide oxidoreductase [Bacillus canaveralius]PLR97874.1 pyridine nucleotide-disulfide oxidoreductase [Bacillus canaveralius]
MKNRIVVLGGGSAGTMVANKLARQLGEQVKNGDVEIVLLSNTEKHIYQPGYLFIAFNEKPSKHFIRKQETLVHKLVNLVFDDIIKIVPEKKMVASAKIQYPYDYLVIATGSHLDFDSVPGLKEGAHNFYTLEGAERLRDDLAAMEKGRIMITVDVPHKCPAAPLELALMLDDYFRKQGKRKDIEIKYTYPIGRIHSLAPVAEWALPEFEKRDIKYETFFNLEEVDPKRKVAITMDGEEHQYDMLVAIPAHTGAKAVIDSGIGDESGFIPTGRSNLKMIGRDDIYVIGDATNLPISKAGSTAHYQSESLVANIINRVNGLPETAVYNGKVACFLENSLENASMITFDYNNPPEPAATSDLFHWFKAVYNELYWLNAKGIL